MKEKLFSVGKKDCVFKYYKGEGKGGQKKNKTENCCQVTHIGSGAQASSEDGRSKLHNQQKAFAKLLKTKKFKNFLMVEAARKTGELAKINEEIDKQMKKIKVEVKEDGLWVDEQTPQKL